MKPVMTLKEVGAILGISANRAWQLEQSALRKLRRRLSHLEKEVVG